jgi:hypothetical protein
MDRFRLDVAASGIAGVPEVFILLECDHGHANIQQSLICAGLQLLKRQ